MRKSAAGAVVRNRHRDDAAVARAAARLFPAEAVRVATREIRSWAGYEPTPLVPLALPRDGDTAGDPAAGRVLAKIERERFGLGSFKVLGGACAVLRHAAGGDGAGGASGVGGAVDAGGAVRYVCGSAGNHGMSVAWGARRAGREATVFVPGTTSEDRIARLRAQAADVRVVAGDYEEALREAWAAARSGGGVLVSDFSDEPDGSTAPVLWGYATIVEEIAAAGVRPTHVFVPAGVGALAAAIVAACHDHFAPAPPSVLVVEPIGAPCVAESLRLGRRARLPAPPRTCLAPLACPVPSADAWPLLAAGVDAAVTVTDEVARSAAGRLAADLLAPPAPPAAPDNCGAAALAGYLDAALDPSARRALALGPDATVVVLLTE